MNPKLVQYARHLDAGMIVVVCLIALGLWIFAELADDVVEGDTETLDVRILLALRNPADRSDPLGAAWVEELGRDFTALGGVAVLVVVTAVSSGYLILEKKRQMACFLLAAIGGGIILSLLMKHGFSRPRPDLVPHAAHVYTSSFPSGHSMMSALTYLTLAALLARVHRRRVVKVYLIGVATLLTVAVGVSRVYLGVHWPTDVLAGWTAGAAWALLCWLVARRLQVIGRLETAGLPVESEKGDEVDETTGIR